MLFCSVCTRIMKTLTLLVCSHLCVLLQTCPANAQSPQYLGPYKEIYPFTDITQDQKDCVPTANRTCPLYVALMISFGGDFVSSGVIPGVQLALNQINSDPSMLPGYSLHYTLTDTQCDRTTALTALHTELLQPPTKIGIIGSGCSVATEPTAEVSRYYNLTHVSCASSSTELTNRTRFIYHFGTLATEANLAYGFYSIIRYFNWNRVMILLQRENLFEVTMTRLTQMLQAAMVDVDQRPFSSIDGIDGLVQPFDKDHRIYIVAMYENHARRLLCEAYKQDILYPRYLFLFYGWYRDKWWIACEEENISCTPKQLESVIGPALSPVQDEFISNCSRNTHTGIDGNYFYREAERLFQNSTLHLPSFSVYSQQCYDATWTLALGLNDSITSIKNNASLRENLTDFNEGVDFSGLQHFTYNNSGFVDILHGHLKGTNFEGISGNIKFNNATGVRLLSNITVFQYRRSNNVECSKCTCINETSSSSTIRRERIAMVDIREPSVFNVTFDGELWTSGVPFDGIPMEELQAVHVSLTVVFFILSTAGVVLAVFFMVFNFIFREKKLIRLTSPNLNYLICTGAIILYVDIYFYVIPVTDKVAVTVFCNFTAWLTAIGYSLCYGTIVAKMFRVFYIFRNPTAKKRTLQDWMLALIVLVFVAIDILILLVYLIYNGASRTLDAVRLSNKENPSAELGERGIVYEYYFYFCDSFSRDVCLGIIYGYKAVLQIIALVFSFSIRKVKVKGLNDAKSIAAAVYVTSIVTAVIIVSFYSLKEYLNSYATVFCLGLFIGTTAILCLIFIPKMVSLYRDPEGEDVFSKSTPGSFSSPQATGINGKGQKLENQVEELQDQVRELQFALSKYEPNNTSERKSSKVTFSELDQNQLHSPSNGVTTSNGTGSEMNSSAL